MTSKRSELCILEPLHIVLCRKALLLHNRMLTMLWVSASSISVFRMLLNQVIGKRYFRTKSIHLLAVPTQGTFFTL